MNSAGGHENSVTGCILAEKPLLELWVRDCVAPSFPWSQQQVEIKAFYGGAAVVYALMMLLMSMHVDVDAYSVQACNRPVHSTEQHS